jgi:hypothetical protein
MVLEIQFALFRAKYFLIRAAGMIKQTCSNKVTGPEILAEGIYCKLAREGERRGSY